MGNVAITLVMKDYDYLAPLACGDVTVAGVDLTLDRRSPMTRTLADTSIHAGELSFSHYLIRTSGGDRSFVGIPLFAYRAFRHRCFYVRRASGLGGFADLEGTRVGTNSYPDTGNTWSRAALREAGVRIERIDWMYGPIDAPSDGPPARPALTLPPNVRPAPSGRALRDMLVDGEVDALMCPAPPRGFYDADSEIVRLIPDFRTAEQAYYRRTGLYPAHHIVGVRREVVERAPGVIRSLYRAIEESQAAWLAQRRALSETTPWMLADIEETVALMGADWAPHGLTDANRKMIEAFCGEQLAQHLVARPIDATGVFAEFAQIMRTGAG